MLCINNAKSFFIFTALDASAVWAEGPGLEAEGVMVKKQATFVVHTEKAGSAKVEVKCLGPSKLSFATFLCQDISKSLPIPTINHISLDTYCFSVA